MRVLVSVGFSAHVMLARFYLEPCVSEPLNVTGDVGEEFLSAITLLVTCARCGCGILTSCT